MSSQQALKTKQVFVRYVSHEIRTPLNIAVLGMDYLEEKLNLADEQKGAIGDTMEEIKLSCSIAVEILNDFLLYEKMDDGIFNLSLSRVFFAPIIDESHKLFDLQAKSANISFTTDLKCPYVRHTEILVDRKKFYQVLRNLLSNAIKFTPEGGTVTLTAYVVNVAEKSAGYPEGDTSWWQMLDGHPIYFAAEVPRYSAAADSAVSTSSTPHATTSSQGNHDKGSGMLASKASFTGAFQPPQESLTISTSPAVPDLSNSQATSSSMTMVFDVPKIDDCPAFLRIIVSDTGAGIDVADQKNLFHQFIQVRPDKLQQGQGSGLGLWIAANIMKMHGGRIGVMSEGEGKGSTFLIDIPLVEEEDTSERLDERAAVDDVMLPNKRPRLAVSHDPEDDHTPSSLSLRGGHQSSALASPELLDVNPLPVPHGSRATMIHHSSAGNKEAMACTQPRRLLKDINVLIVDDVPSNRKVVRRLLRDKFGSIDEAENGQVAVNKVHDAIEQGKPFDLILMDFMMPVMNGLDATRLIQARCHGNTPHDVLVIGVTGNGLEADIAAFKEAGADEVMLKPLDYPTFLKHLYKYGYDVTLTTRP